MPVSARVSIEIARGRSGTPASLQRVRDAVGEQRVDAGPGGEDLGRRDAARRRIAVARRQHVATQLLGHPCERARSRPWQQRSGQIPSALAHATACLRSRAQGAKKACET